MFYPEKCPECGSTRIHCAEKIWNEVIDGEVTRLLDSSGFTGESVCPECRHEW